MLNKKSQATMEFFITYGWAILIVLVVVGTLTAFGIFNTDYIMPERCRIGSYGTIECIDYVMHQDGILLFNLENNGNKGDLIITKVTADIDKEKCGGTLPEPLLFPAHKDILLYVGQDLAADKKLEHGCNALLGKSTNKKIKTGIKIEYKTVSSDSEHTMAGELITSIENQDGACSDCDIICEDRCTPDQIGCSDDSLQKYTCDMTTDLCYDKQFEDCPSGYTCQDGECISPLIALNNILDDKWTCITERAGKCTITESVGEDGEPDYSYRVYESPCGRISGSLSIAASKEITIPPPPVYLHVNRKLIVSACCGTSCDRCVGGECSAGIYLGTGTTDYYLRRNVLEIFTKTGYPNNVARDWQEKWYDLSAYSGKKLKIVSRARHAYPKHNNQVYIKDVYLTDCNPNIDSCD